MEVFLNLTLPALYLKIKQAFSTVIFIRMEHHTAIIYEGWQINTVLNINDLDHCVARPVYKINPCDARAANIP